MLNCKSRNHPHNIFCIFLPLSPIFVVPACNLSQERSDCILWPGWDYRTALHCRVCNVSCKPGSAIWLPAAARRDRDLIYLWRPAWSSYWPTSGHKIFIAICIIVGWAFNSKEQKQQPNTRKWEQMLKLSFSLLCSAGCKWIKVELVEFEESSQTSMVNL